MFGSQISTAAVESLSSSSVRAFGTLRPPKTPYPKQQRGVIAFDKKWNVPKYKDYYSFSPRPVGKGYTQPKSQVDESGKRTVYPTRKTFILENYHQLLSADSQWVMVLSVQVPDDFGFLQRKAFSQKFPNIHSSLVIQNKLAMLATESHPSKNLEGIKALMFGTNALLVQKKKETAVEDLKKVLEYLKTTQFQVLGGWFQGTLVSAKQMQTITELPSAFNLQAQAIQMISAPQQNLIRMLTGQQRGLIKALQFPSTQAVKVAQFRADQLQKEEQPSQPASS